MNPSSFKRVFRPILIGGVVVGVGAFVLARQAHSSDPPGEPVAEAPGGDRPAWTAIKLGKPLPSEARWSDPIPARIAFDETKASRLGSPLAGRVTAVFVE